MTATITKMSGTKNTERNAEMATLLAALASVAKRMAELLAEDEAS